MARWQKTTTTTTIYRLRDGVMSGYVVDAPGQPVRWRVDHDGGAWWTEGTADSAEAGMVAAVMAWPALVKERSNHYARMDRLYPPKK